MVGGELFVVVVMDVVLLFFWIVLEGWGVGGLVFWWIVVGWLFVLLEWCFVDNVWRGRGWFRILFVFLFVGYVWVWV